MYFEDISPATMSDDHTDDMKEVGNGAQKPPGEPWPQMAPECDPHRVEQQKQDGGQADDNGTIDAMLGNSDLQEIELKEEVVTMCKAAMKSIRNLDELVTHQRNIIEDLSPLRKQQSYEVFFANPAVKVHYEHFAKTIDKCESMIYTIQQKPTVQQQEETVSQKLAEATISGSPFMTEQASWFDSQQPSTSTQHSSQTNSTYAEKAGQPPQQPKRVQPDDKQQRRTNAGTYVMVLKARTEEIINPVAVVYDALKDVRAHVAKTELKGLNARIRLFKRKDYEVAYDKISKHVVNGHPMTHWYDFTLVVSSLYSARTEAVSGQTASKVPFTKEGRVDQKAAAQVLFMRNPTWFKHMADIEYVEMHPVPGQCETKYLFEIHMSREAHQRLKRMTGNATVDLVTARLGIYDAIKPEECFRCLQPGHFHKSCRTGEPQCKYCPGKHLSVVCRLKNQTAKHTCYRCTEANQKRGEKARVLDVRHMATSTRCKFVRERRAALRKKNKAKERKTRHG